MKRKITINYYWDNYDSTEINPKHQEALEESALDRITEMMKEGSVCGELHDNIRMLDSDPEDGIEYTGSWDIKKEGD
jgi:hypothetical protein